MRATRMTTAGAMVALIAIGCSGWDPPSAESGTEAPAVSTSAGSTAGAGDPGRGEPPLVPDGCDNFDGAILAGFSPIELPLALVESRSEPERLTCNFVGTDGSLDTAVRVVVELLSAHRESFFTTAGELESAIEIAGRVGVGTGRGTLRVQLDDRRGMTLAVTIRALSSSARAPRDGEYLSIRDAIAAYLIERLD